MPFYHSRFQFECATSAQKYGDMHECRWMTTATNFVFFSLYFLLFFFFFLTLAHAIST